MKDCDSKSDVTIFCSGSEVWVALEVAEKLSNLKVRVVNIPCWELFDKQSEEYKINVLGDSNSLKVSIEAGITMGWQKFTGTNGLNFGVDTFGESAPGQIVAEKFGLTSKNISKSILII